MTKTGKPIIANLMPGLVVLGVAFLFGRDAWNSQRLFDRMSVFVPHPGVVVDAGTTKSPGGKIARIYPRVRFRYVVGGVEHESERWSNVLPSFRRSKEAVRLASEALAKKDVTIYINPNDAGEAIFELPREAGAGLSAAVAAVVGSLGIVSVGWVMWARISGRSVDG